MGSRVASFSVWDTQRPPPHLTQSKRHSRKDSSLSLNFHGNESIYLRTRGGGGRGMGDEFPFLNADGLNPLCFLLLKKKKDIQKLLPFTLLDAS